MSDVGTELERRLARFERTITRERAARAEAERLLEQKSLEIYTINQRLIALNAELETRVYARTLELEQERRAAVALAECDILTGLANRVRFQSHLVASLGWCSAGNGELAMLMIDMDRFKLVNDQRGHAAGDALLIEVAKRLRECTRASDLVARLGGDEFAIVLSCHDNATDAGVQLAERISSALAVPWSHQGIVASASCSIGVATAPLHTGLPTDLLRFADLALYEAKAAGTGGHKIFQPDMVETFEHRCVLEQDLRAAIAAREITVWFQPIVNAATGDIVAAEALARWTHPTRGQIPPDCFIAIAEHRGLIVDLGGLVIPEACRQARNWLTEGRLKRISVNISPLQLQDPGVVDHVIDVLRENGLKPNQLLLEVTESVMLAGSPTVSLTLEALRAHGISFALDDFGAGYSNLSYLTQLRVDALKIDRGFVRDLETEFATGAMIRSITALAHELGVTVVVEGVETPGQLARIASYGCDFAQGYLFSRPVPRMQFDALLQPPSIAEGRVGSSLTVRSAPSKATRLPTWRSSSLPTA